MRARCQHYPQLWNRLGRGGGDPYESWIHIIGNPGKDAHGPGWSLRGLISATGGPDPSPAPATPFQAGTGLK